MSCLARMACKDNAIPSGPAGSSVHLVTSALDEKNALMA
ncbi:Unknown protein sequence [Pseudomonas coronafaciens pv. oryzae]|nr:Unknown protein sequence [Pseudomonas coronafaciens pv. oryzae]